MPRETAQQHSGDDESSPQHPADRERGDKHGENDTEALDEVDRAMDDMENDDEEAARSGARKSDEYGSE